jgi:ArsR family transcriptional regulator, arsenate/arsenite/antimonite-responsive transcriptional repressor
MRLIMNDRFAEGARIFKALCDENRLAILDLLRSGERCACVILEELDISQSTLSHHLKVLCESGMVEAREEGKWTHYSLSRDGCAAAARALVRFTSERKPARKKGAVRCA